MLPAGGAVDRGQRAWSGSASVSVQASVRISQLGSVVKRHSHELSAGRSVPERMGFRLNFHAGSEGLWNAAPPRQTAGTAELDDLFLASNIAKE
jgi:hypothetical protein